MKIRMKLCRGFLRSLLLFIAWSGGQAMSQTGPPGDLDAYMERVRREFDVPGISLAVVKDGKAIVAKGYGIRTLGKPERVDARTLFGIASNTKAFTATAFALLVEEGKLEWNGAVIRRCARTPLSRFP